MNAMTKPEQDLAGAGSASEPEALPRRRWRRLALMLVLPLALVAGGGYFWLTGGRYQSTDNAYLQHPNVQIAAEESGRVIEVNAHENALVSAGDVLFRIDPEPYRIALQKADASLAAARIEVEQLRARFSAAEADQAAARSDVDYLTLQFDRQQALADRGVAAAATLDAAQRDLRTARDRLNAAGQAAAGARAALDGDPGIDVNDHPAVQAAAAARADAAWALEHTTVRAPANGRIAQASSFKDGQFVSAGTPLFALVETQESWVEANFKETQLTHLEPGQTAEIVFDTFPDRPVAATVESIGAGTGAEFSLLPAQNATGNWVKVTQRIPVRLKLEPEAAELGLRLGMSASVEVDTRVERSLAGLLSGSAALAAAN